MKKYYMVADQDDIIWGIGKSKSEARQDAQKNVNYSDYNNNVVELQKAIECNKYLYDKVQTSGSNEEDAWSIIGDIAILDEEIKQEEVYNKLNDFENMNIADRLTTIYKILINNP